MNKTTLRNVIGSLTANQEILVRLRSSATPESFTVVGQRTGRGKGGSLLADLRNAAGEPVTIGTPKNQDVLNITAGGEFYGTNDEREDPLPYLTDEANAVTLKETAMSVLGATGVGRKVKLGSTLPEFTGQFTVVAGKLEKGRYGQAHLTLCPEGQTPENIVEFYSYTHSGVVNFFEVLETVTAE